MPRVAIIVPDLTPQPYRFALDRAKVSIGRGKENDIIIDDPSVSGLHCTMERVSGGYILRDQRSTNGISLDDNEMEIIDLRNGDDVKVGDVVFEYSLSEDELDELDHEDFETHEKKKEVVRTPPTPPKNKIKPATAQPAATYTPPSLVLSSSSSGSGMIGFGAFVLGVLALFAGMNNGYVSKQEDRGRKGDFSLFGDIKDGRPALEEKTEE
ncbi:MAG: FHA domain-containing protein [Akkermansiaceae bacterium]